MAMVGALGCAWRVEHHHFPAPPSRLEQNGCIGLRGQGVRLGRVGHLQQGLFLQATIKPIKNLKKTLTLLGQNTFQ